MSSFSAYTMLDRVMLVHDMGHHTILSELDAEQADILLQQLQLAVRQSLTALGLRAGQALAVALV